MDESGVLGLLEELSILLEDAKPVFGKQGLRQVDVTEAFEIIDEIRDRFLRLALLCVSARICWMTPRQRLIA